MKKAKIILFVISAFFFATCLFNGVCNTCEHDWYQYDNYNGYKYYRCYKCGEDKKEEDLCYMGLHDWEYYYSSGNYNYYRCINCGETKQENTSSTCSHSWYINYQTNTCTSSGYVYYSCYYCNETKTEYQSAKGHSWYKTNTVSSTCTENGTNYYSCYNCTKTKEETINKKGHNWYKTNTVNSTCTENGTEYYSCYNCSNTKQETIYATGHDMTGNYELAYKPTCSINGEQTKYCKNNCGHTETSSLTIQNKQKHEYLSIGSTCSSCGYKCVDNDESAVLLYDATNNIYCAEYYGTIASNIYNSYDLTAIYISNTTTTITDSAFYEQDKLQTIIFEGNSTLETIDSSAFQYCSNLTTINFSNCTSLTTIGSSAFYRCYKLTSIDFSNCTNLTTIEGATFDHCNNLTSVDLSNCTSLTTIGNYTFQYCGSLTSIDLSNCTSLTTIGSSAFGNCKELTNIYLPNSLVSVGNYAFSGCNISFNTKNGVKYIGTTTNPYLIAYLAKSNGLTTVVLNEDCKIIADDAFSGCSYLEYIIIPKEIKGIGNLDSDITKYYLGSSQDWQNVYCCGYYSYCSHKDNTYFYIENDEELPNGSKTYWHYDTDGITPIMW